MSSLIAFHEFDTWLKLAGLLVVLVALVATTRGADAFHAAGRSVPPMLAGMATSAAFLSAAPFLGLTGLVYALGSDGLAWLIGLAGGLVLMGVLLAPAMRRSGAVSVPGLLAQRFGGRLVPLLATLVVAGVSFTLLVTQLATLGALVADATFMNSVLAIVIAAGLIALVLASGGLRAVTWVSILLMLAVIAAFLLPLGAWTLAEHGTPAGPLVYGQTLRALRDMEIEMISAGLADAASLKPHLSQFLQLDYANTLALIATVMAGTAVLPHVLMRHAATRGVAQTRMASAWTLLFVVAVLSAIPAYAAMTKHEVYRLVGQGVALADVPEALRHDDVAVHGVPYSLYEDVIGVLTPGVDVNVGLDALFNPRISLADKVVPDPYDITGVGEHLRVASPRSYAAWQRLTPDVQSALLAASRGQRLTGQPGRFDTWRKTILPVAAAAAGDTTGKLTQGAIALNPDRTTTFGLRLGGVSATWMSLYTLGAILAAFATALAAAWALAQCLGSDLVTSWRGPTLVAPAQPVVTAPVRIGAVLTVLAAVPCAVMAPSDSATAATWIFSILAAGLFPVLVLGLWWRRVTAAGAIAGIIAGVAVTLGTIAMTELAPQHARQIEAALPHWTGPVTDEGSTFADTSDDFSGGETTVAPTPLDTEAPQPEIAAATGLAGEQAATLLGIHNRAAGVFGLPLGFVVIFLVSLLTRRPSATHAATGATPANA